MFEKEAKEYADEYRMSDDYSSAEPYDIGYANGLEIGFEKGAEFGYNKANEWQYVSEKGLPKESGRYLVYVGGGENGVYPLDFETEYNDFGYWCSLISCASLGVVDTVFETITERNEDKVIAWKEIVLPSEPMRSLNKEEQKNYTEAINKVYKPTGVKLFDKE